MGPVIGDFSSLLTGLNFSAGGAGGTTTPLAVSTEGNLLSTGINSLGAAATGGPIAGAIAAITGIVGLLNSHGVPDHERPDLNTIAAANDITADQASWVCGLEESHVDDNYDDIVAHAARDKSYFQQLAAKYNAANPQAPVVGRTEQATQQYTQLQAQLATSFAATGNASPLANLSFAQAQAEATAQGISLSDYLTSRISVASAKAQATESTGTSLTAGLTTDDTLLYVGAGVGVLVLTLILVLIFKK